MAAPLFPSSHHPARPATLAVVVSPGVSTYLPRTLAGIAGQTHVPDVVLVVDVGAPGRELGTGIPLHEAVTDAGLDGVTRVRVVHAPTASTFGDAVRQGLVEYATLVERAAAKAARRGFVGATASRSLVGVTGSRAWSGVTGELSPVTTGEMRAVGAHGGEPDREARAEWLWLLHDDSAPAPAALDQLLHAAESGRSVAVAGAKQRDWYEPDRLLEVGLRTTRTGRRVADIEPGEIDQGQHDHREDVLAVGTAGALVRLDVWTELGGTDPVLGPFGDGLDLCRRARLAGYRVVVVPTAIVHHARASYLGLRSEGGAPDPVGPARGPGGAAGSTGAVAVPAPPAVDVRRSFHPRRRAQVYNALLAAPGPLVPLLAVVLLVLAPLRALGRVATKELALAGPEIAAVLAVLARPGALWRARRQIRRTRRIPARALRPLLTTGREIRAAKRDARRLLSTTRHVTEAPSELEIAEKAALARRRRVTLTLVTLLLTVTALVAYLPTVLAGALTGGALLPADATFTEVWAVARASWIPTGDGHPGPADPFQQVLAVAMLLVAPFGANANALITALVLVAVPLAGLGAWFAAGAATRSVALRGWAALVWALAPTLLLATGQGRLGAVLAHLALPWVALGVARTVGAERRDVILSGLVGAQRVRVPATTTSSDPAAEPATPSTDPAAQPDRHRAGSVTAAGAAALAFAVAAAGAPVLLPAGIVLAVLLALVVPRRRRWVLFVPVPALALLGPVLVAALSDVDVDAGSWRLLLADPGAAYAAVPGAAWLSVLGWPVEPPGFPGLADANGALGVIGQWALVAGGVSLLLAALAALLRGSGRVRAVRAGWLVAVVGLVAALASARTDVALGTGTTGAAEIVRGWAGSGLSLAVLGLLVAAVSAGDGARAALATRSFGWAQVGAGVLSVLAFAGPLLTAGGWLAAVRTSDAPTTVLAVHGRAGAPVPAVAAEMQSSVLRSRVLALRPAGDTVRAEIWRGHGAQVTETATVAAALDLSGAPTAEVTERTDAADAELANLVAALTVGGAGDVAVRLGAHAVGIVVVPPEPVHVPAGTEPTTAERTDLIARLDATDGLERITENASGVIWRVARGDGEGATKSVARARVVADGAWVHDLDARAVDIRTVLPRGPEGRTLVLAERSDPGWRAWYDGRPLRATTEGWRQAFELPPHTGTLTVTHESPQGAAWTWVQGVVLGLTVLLALPLRRRREAE
ncbi:glycosyltransferase family 2 protein [Georgenia yuyongxinii]|uniref:Glycosyltransferase family 2 protein n=1 Tax=Georgenia yuyongxinii TaxID=2589797 RepID=A0A5B8C490_9MICO|nr:glycosyltransferase [Georgenia yuyongxinii]QDC25579.1 glycosyltransferase family 2 protein [Georgenia yuyongxinii]